MWMSEIKDDLSRFLREAEKQAIIIKPDGVLIGSSEKTTGLITSLKTTRVFLSV